MFSEKTISDYNDYIINYPIANKAYFYAVKDANKANTLVSKFKNSALRTGRRVHHISFSEFISSFTNAFSIRQMYGELPDVIIIDHIGYEYISDDSKLASQVIKEILLFGHQNTDIGIVLCGKLHPKEFSVRYIDIPTYINSYKRVEIK